MPHCWTIRFCPDLTHQFKSSTQGCLSECWISSWDMDLMISIAQLVKRSSASNVTYNYKIRIYESITTGHL